jgi:hypothetical protein
MPIDPEILKQLQMVMPQAGQRPQPPVGQSAPPPEQPTPFQTPNRTDPGIANLLKLAAVLGLDMLNRAGTKPLTTPYGGEVYRGQPAGSTGGTAVNYALATQQQKKQKEADAAAQAEAERKAGLEERRMKVSEKGAESTAGYKEAMAELAGQKLSLAQKENLRKQGLTDAQIANYEWDNLHPRPVYPPNYVINPPGQLTPKDALAQITNLNNDIQTWVAKISVDPNGNAAILKMRQATDTSTLANAYKEALTAIQSMPQSWLVDPQSAAQALQTIHDQMQQILLYRQYLSGGAGNPQTSTPPTAETNLMSDDDYNNWVNSQGE